MRNKTILRSFLVCSLTGAVYTHSGHPVQQTEQLTTADGVTLHYEVKGEGEPLFLISMGPGYAPDYLYPVRDRLSTSFRTVLIHLRGTGKSQMTSVTPTTMTMDLVLSDIDAVRRDLQLDRINIMGNSFGGIISMSYAVQYPASVSHLVLVGSGGLSMAFTRYFRANIRSRLLPWEVEALEYWSDPERLARDPVKANHEMLRITVPAYFYDRTRSFEMLGTLTASSFDPRISDLLWMDLAAAGFDLAPQLRRLDVSALIIIGRQDIVGEATAYEIHNALRDSELVFFEECGHFPWIE
ncbi:MAG: alpha/beta fold hydrolase, partial [Gemmatimonadales bacterium]|nr:alpha/beta fold hydrolase [Gemmatimonadales bacterium]